MVYFREHRSASCFAINLFINLREGSGRELSKAAQRGENREWREGPALTLVQSPAQRPSLLQAEPTLPEVRCWHPPWQGHRGSETLLCSHTGPPAEASGGAIPGHGPHGLAADHEQLAKTSRGGSISSLCPHSSEGPLQAEVDSQVSDHHLRCYRALEQPAPLPASPPLSRTAGRSRAPTAPAQRQGKLSPLCAQQVICRAL